MTEEIRTRTYGYVEGCPRCFIENKACARHCNPATCLDPAHHRTKRYGYVASTRRFHEGDWVEGVAATLEDAQMIAEAEGLDGEEWATVGPWVACFRHGVPTWEAEHEFGWLVVQAFEVIE